jgi:Flp pilus assembly pilin Flp
MFLRLWKEETGAILSAEVMLVASILVVGVIAGLASLRDSIVTELADVAQAVANVNQSFSFSGVAGHHTFAGGGSFEDNIDFCDRQWAYSDKGNSKCVRICSSGDSGETDGHGGHGHGGKGW